MVFRISDVSYWPEVTPWSDEDDITGARGHSYMFSDQDPVLTNLYMDFFIIFITGVLAQGCVLITLAKDARLIHSATLMVNHVQNIELRCLIIKSKSKQQS